MLGLTKNEAKLYEAILTTSELNVHNLASATDLPRTRIYEILAKLAAKNLLEKKPNNTGYRLVPPSDAISSILIHLDNKYQNEVQVLNELSSYLQKIYSNSVSNDLAPGVSIIPFQEGEVFLLNHLKNIKYKVDIAVSSKESSINWSKSGISLSKAFHNDIKVRYLTKTSDLAHRINRAFKQFMPYKDVNFSIKYSNELYTSYIIIDDVIYLFFLGLNQSPSLETLVMRTSSENLTKSFEWMFNKLWNDGFDLTDKK